MFLYCVMLLHISLTSSGVHVASVVLLSILYTVFLRKKLTPLCSKLFLYEEKVDKFVYICMFCTFFEFYTWNMGCK
jgi:hypothetical protein